MVIVISLYNIVIIGFSLSIDALSVCVSNSLINNSRKSILKMSIAFGFFQFLMTYLGSILGSVISYHIVACKNFFSFALFTIIGLNTIFNDESFISIDNFFTLILMAILTSIDAFSLGIVIPLYNINIILASAIIGFITLFNCICASLISYSFSKYLSNKASLIGGVSLIVLGIYFLFSSI